MVSEHLHRYDLNDCREQIIDLRDEDNVICLRQDLMVALVSNRQDLRATGLDLDDVAQRLFHNVRVAAKCDDRLVVTAKPTKALNVKWRDL